MQERIHADGKSGEGSSRSSGRSWCERLRRLLGGILVGVWVLGKVGGWEVVYAERRVPGQLGLKERERGQQLAHGARRWRPSVGRRRNLVKHLR